MLEMEVKQGLSAGAAASRKQAKAAFWPWYDTWRKNLPADEHQVWVLMEAQRRNEVHLLGAETVKATKAIVLEPPKSNPAFLHHHELRPTGNLRRRVDGGEAPPRPAIMGQRVARSSGSSLQVAGERHDVVETCQRYLTLLERLLTDFRRSSLADTSNG